MPSCANMSEATLTTREMAVSPSTFDARWIRVLIVSMGALLNGPSAPEINPIAAVSYEGRSFVSCMR